MLVTIQAVAIALLALLVVGLLRSHAEILRALHDLGVNLDGSDSHASHGDRLPASRGGDAGSAAHDLGGLTPDGDAVAIGVTGEGRTLLAFLTSSCLTCQGFWTAFGDPSSLDLPPGVRLVVVTKGPDQESPPAVAERAAPGLPVVMTTDAWLDYEIQVAPYFVLVDGTTGEIVGEGAGQTWDQVRSLLGQSLGDVEVPFRRRERPGTGPDDEDAVDRALLAAGIEPGDPRLFHGPDDARPAGS